MEESSEGNYDNYMNDVAAIVASISVSPDCGRGVGGYIGCDIVGIPNGNKGKNKKTLLPFSPVIILFSR